MQPLLNGLRILNTRPLEQGQRLSQQIRAAGGVAITCPTIEIQPESVQWMKKLPALSQVDYAIFISANAVHYCFEQLIVPWPDSIKVFAIGRATAAKLASYSIRVDGVPLTADSEHLLSLPTLHPLQHRSILLFKGEGGRKLIKEALLSQGAQLLELNVYKRVIPNPNTQFINSLWHDDGMDIILLTSVQSMQNLFKLFHKDAHPWLSGKTFLVISTRLAEAARLMGLRNILVSPPDKIIQTLAHYKD